MSARKSLFVLFFLLLMFPLFFPLRAVSAQGPSATLIEALSYVPAMAEVVEFTNFSYLKRHENAANLTSKGPDEAQTRFFRAVSERHAMLLVEYMLVTPEHARVWGWNAVDLRFGVSATLKNATVTIFSLRHDYDMRALIGLLQKRQFTTTQVAGATLYQHPIDMNAEWLRVNLLSINTAILEEDKIIIMSTSEEAVKAVLGARSKKTTYAAIDAIRTITEQVGEVAAAALEINRCLDYNSTVAELLRDTEITQKTLVEAMRKHMTTSAKFAPYPILALAYRYEAAKPIGILIMNYSNATDASKDLATRRKGAAEGVSIGSKSPYKQNVFRLKSAATNGNNLVFRLHPFNNQPTRLFQMYHRRDMAFAGC